jgi:hypothetical protein
VGGSLADSLGRVCSVCKVRRLVRSLVHSRSFQPHGQPCVGSSLIGSCHYSFSYDGSFLIFVPYSSGVVV